MNDALFYALFYALLTVSVVVIAALLIGVVPALAQRDHPRQGFWCWLRSRLEGTRVWVRYVAWQNMHVWDCFRCGEGGEMRHG